MFRLRVQNSFSSAHSLRNYNGACAKLHGHNWKAEVIIAKKTVDDIGISIDFNAQCIVAITNRLPQWRTINP